MATERTWYTACNLALADCSTATLTAKSVLWAIKAMLTGGSIGATLGHLGTPPSSTQWTVYGSSDSSTAGLDGSDRWTTTFNASKLVRAAAGVAHSWIVLRSPDAMGPYYFIIDYVGGADTSCAIVGSKNAPTGGSITARPTATDEFSLSSAGTTFVDTGTAWVAGRGHFTVDQAGHFWMVFSRNGDTFVRTVFYFGMLTGCRDTDTYRAVCGLSFNASLCLNVSDTNISGASSLMRSKSPVAIAYGMHSVVLPLVAGANIYTTLSGASPDGTYEVGRMEIFCQVSGAIGQKGMLVDLRWAPVALANAARIPTAGSIEYVCFGDVLLPFTAVPTL